MTWVDFGRTLLPGARTAPGAGTGGPPILCLAGTAPLHRRKAFVTGLGLGRRRRTGNQPRFRHHVNEETRRNRPPSSPSSERHSGNFYGLPALPAITAGQRTFLLFASKCLTLGREEITAYVGHAFHFPKTFPQIRGSGRKEVGRSVDIPCSNGL